MALNARQISLSYTACRRVVDLHSQHAVAPGQHLYNCIAGQLCTSNCFPNTHPTFRHFSCLSLSPHSNYITFIHIVEMKLIHALALFAATASYALPQGLPIVGGLLGGAAGGDDDAGSSAVPQSSVAPQSSAAAHESPKATPSGEHRHSSPNEPAESAAAAASLSSTAPEQSEAPGLPIVGGILRRTADSTSAAPEQSEAPGLPIIGGILRRTADSTSAAPEQSEAPGLPIIGGILRRTADHPAEGDSAAPETSDESELPLDIVARAPATPTIPDVSTLPKLPVADGLLPRTPVSAAHTEVDSDDFEAKASGSTGNNEPEAHV